MMRRPAALLSIVVALTGCGPGEAQAQPSRDRLPVIVPDPDATTVAPKGDRQSQGSGGTVSALPDAVTILNMLRRLPTIPPRGGDSLPPDPGPPNIRLPPPQSTGDANRQPPKRIITGLPNDPVRPSPRPRQPGEPPVTPGPLVPEIRDREVIVALGPRADANTVYEIGQDLGLDGETLYASALLGQRIARFFIPDGRAVADVLQQLASDARVAEAQPSYVFAESQGASRQLPAPQYAPAKLNLDDAHRLSRGASVRIAVIDSAIDPEHPALRGAIAARFDALGDQLAQPETHGTAIAGILAARAELVGVAPASDVLAIRAFARLAAGPAQSHTLALLKALDWAAVSGARVMNMSFAGPNDPLLGRAVAAAIAKGITIVAAAGNGGPAAKPAYPAAYPDVIAVTATDADDATYKDANRGAYIALAAPGVDIITSAPGGAYDITSGTSMAAAHVSGVAALLLERDPALSPAEIRERLAATARTQSGRPRDELGAGVVDAERAVTGK